MNLTATSRLLTTLLAIASVCLAAPSASAQRLLDRDEVVELNGVEVTEELGNAVPLDATFTDHNGDTVVFGDYFDGETPVVLVMVYYQCPVVCPTVLTQLTNSLNEISYTAGDDYRVLVVSFDHNETTTMALGQRTKFLDAYNQSDIQGARAGIAFHTGDVLNIRRLVTSIGFNFNPTDDGQYAHPISLMILSPEGQVSRYMYGFDYPPQELKLSLLDASEGKIAESFGDRLLHFCYQFDPNAGVYSLQAFRVMQIGALLTVVLIVIGLTLLFMGERVRRRKYIEQQSQNTDTNTTSGEFAGANTGHVS
ncbi:MAG: SCO family protein [Phycisphaerales bacterium]